MGNNNCCTKRQDELGMHPIGSILRHDNYDGEDAEVDRTYQDVAALIKEDHQRLHIRQSHINMLDESIRIQ